MKGKKEPRARIEFFARGGRFKVATVAHVSHLTGRLRPFAPAEMAPLRRRIPTAPLGKRLEIGQSLRIMCAPASPVAKPAPGPSPGMMALWGALAILSIATIAGARSFRVSVPRFSYDPGLLASGRSDDAIARGNR